MFTYISEPVYKKNYIKENVKHIKRMQGLIQNSNTSERKFNNRDKFRNVPLKSSSQIQEQTTKTKTIPTQNSTVPKLQRLTKSNKSINQKRKKTDDKKDTLVETAVQTERSPESVKKLYENGTIIYPSTHVVKELESQKKQKVQDHGDTNSGKTTANDELSNRLGNMALEGKDYIKENILSLKNKAQRVEKKGDPSKPPPNYQMGVVPKYLKERQEELMQGDIDEPDCPPGHVLLPEEERKETLRVLRQSKWYCFYKIGDCICKIMTVNLQSLLRKNCYYKC